MVSSVHISQQTHTAQKETPLITVKTMTESQDAAIMAGAKPVKVTIRYQDYGGYGRSPRKETVKTTLP